jgi:putative oxidoreductase
MNKKIDTVALTVGRSLLGIYFVLPGLAKFGSWQMHVDLMVKHNIPLAEPLLFIAGIANIVLGGLLLANKQVWLAAYGCAAYIVVINFSLHDFWNYTGVEGAHETQNFAKNVGILAGCLMLASYSRLAKK